MGKIKIRNRLTGEVREVEESELANYGVSGISQTQTSQSTQTTQEEKPKYITGRSLEEHAEALNKAKAVGNTSAIKEIEDNYDREFKYQQEFGKSDEQTAEEKKKAGQQTAVDSLMDKLESRYQGSGAGETNLGLITRILGIGNSIAGKTGFNSEANRYEALKEGFIASLKELTGDTGVLTQEDAERLAGLLPGMGSTREEAQKAFQDLRSQMNAVFGGQDTSTFKPKEKGITDLVLSSARNVANDIGAGITANMTEEKRNKAIESANAEADKLEKMAFVEESPNKKKDLLKRATDLRLQVSKLAKEVSGTFSEDVKKNPLVRGLESGVEIATLAEAPAITKAIFNAPGKVKGALSGDSALLRPAKVGTQLKNEVIEKASQEGKEIPASRVVKAFDEWKVKAVEANPGEEKAINAIADSVKQTYSKGKISAKKAFEIYNEVDSGFTTSGLEKTPVRASSDRLLRKTLRSELDKIAPGFDRAVALQAKGLKRGKFFRKYGTGVAIGAGITTPLSIATGYAVNQILKQKGSQ